MLTRKPLVMTLLDLAALTLAVVILLWGTGLAAAACDGWFLMVPPMIDQRVDATAPLARWRQMLATDSANLCEGGRREAFRIQTDEILREQLALIRK